jgi:hypothetical protein
MSDFARGFLVGSGVLVALVAFGLIARLIRV